MSDIHAHPSVIVNHNNHVQVRHPVGNGIGSRFSQHPPHHRPAVGNYPISKTLEGAVGSGRSPRAPQGSQRSELDLARDTLAKVVELFRNTDDSKTVLKKKIVAIAEMASVCEIFVNHRELGKSHKETLHATYLQGMALMVIYDYDRELDELTWNSLRKEYYEMVEYISQDRLYLPPTERTEDADYDEWEVEPVPAEDEPVVATIRFKAASEKWLHKTLEVFRTARDGYIRLFVDGKLDTQEKLRLSNIHTRLSELAIQSKSPSDALAEAESAMKVLDDMKAAPPRVVSAAAMQIGVCRRILSDFMLAAAVDDIKRSVAIFIKLKVNVEKELEVLTNDMIDGKRFHTIDAERLNLQQQLEDYRVSLLQQVHTLVGAFRSAKTVPTATANDMAREFMESQIAECEEECGLSTNWNFLDMRMVVYSDEPLAIAPVQLDLVDPADPVGKEDAFLHVAERAFAKEWRPSEDQRKQAARSYLKVINMPLSSV